jgi:hypothetical protein
VKYRKKPVVIEAFQWLPDKEANPAPAWLTASHHWFDGKNLMIGTLEGTMRADPGDWIIQGVKGEIYPCKPDIFEATYEAA